MAINYPTSADTFTTKVDNVNDVMAVDVNDVQDAVEILEKRVGITGDEAIVATTKMLIYANVAPANWTIDATLDDKLVFVTKGSGAGGQTGGGAHSTGTWTQPDHTLITAETPAHVHSVSGYIAAHGGGAYIKWGVDSTTNPTSANTSSVGSDGAHNHGTAWRPAAYCFIVCAKDAYPLS